MVPAGEQPLLQHSRVLRLPPPQSGMGTEGLQTPQLAQRPPEAGGCPQPGRYPRRPPRLEQEVGSGEESASSQPPGPGCTAHVTAHHTGTPDSADSPCARPSAAHAVPWQPPLPHRVIPLPHSISQGASSDVTRPSRIQVWLGPALKLAEAGSIQQAQGRRGSFCAPALSRSTPRPSSNLLWAPGAPLASARGQSGVLQPETTKQLGGAGKSVEGVCLHAHTQGGSAPPLHEPEQAQPGRLSHPTPPWHRSPLSRPEWITRSGSCCREMPPTLWTWGTTSCFPAAVGGGLALGRAFPLPRLVPAGVIACARGQADAPTGPGGGRGN